MIAIKQYKQTNKDFKMLVYDYVEINKEMFCHIVGDKSHYKKVGHNTADVYYYKVFKTTVKKVMYKDGNIDQYFIDSAHPV